MERRRVALTVGAVLEKSAPYAAALEDAGLDPEVMSAGSWAGRHPSWEAAAQAALRDKAGLVLAGGGDIDPSLLGRKAIHPTVADVDASRDRFERALFAEAWRRELPILAICRGMQLMNWCLGGTLVDDIDSEVAPRGLPKHHRQTEYGKERHELGHAIQVVPGSRLAAIMGAGELMVNTIHHQALDCVAAPLQVTATAPDGVVEAVEAPDRRFVLGVQFHPEAMVRHHPRFRALFEAFAAAL